MKSYELSAEDVLREQQSDPGGLTGQEAGKRLEQYGPNKLKEARKATLLERFIDQLKDPMLIILMCAAAVSAVTSIISGESLAEVFIILIVVLLNAVLFIPAFHGLFLVADLTLIDIGWIYLLAFIPTVLIQIYKVIKERVK